MNPDNNTTRGAEEVTKAPTLLTNTIPGTAEPGTVIIKRHPFGLVALYLQAIVGLAAAIGLIWFLIPTLISEESQQLVQHWVSLIALGASVFTAFFLLVATYLYRKGQWLVTHDSIQQFQQNGLFDRETSELSMANIEDISAEQNGALATLFGFGTLKVETAGERSNFHFNYCPTPNKYAQIILDARERFIENDPQTAKRANDLLNVPRN